MIQRCSVGTLSEYIAAIEQYNLFHYISRGESREYEHPLRCSIYRHDLDKYTKMLEQYHLDVETSISSIQDKNFLAFAQHHGLPTNLLDFSFSPLVSLYFCVADCPDRGYVYFVKKARMVNINKVIYDKPLGWGMFEELLNYDVDLFKSILPQMSDVFVNNQDEMSDYFEHHALNLIASYRSYREQGLLDPNAGGVEDFERMIRQYEEFKAGWNSDQEDSPLSQLRGRTPSLLKSMQKILKGDPTYPASFFSNYRKVAGTRVDGARYSQIIHVLMFLLKLEEMECYNKTILDPANPVYELEFPFYFTYHPPVIDDRVRNQYSVFIFQPFAANRVLADETGLPSADSDHDREGMSASVAVMEQMYMEESASSVRRYLCGTEPETADGAHAGAGAANPRSTPVQIWQKISPDFIMEIRNPAMIRRELDAIGINSKNIYCDYDSIANYIVHESDEPWQP